MIRLLVVWNVVISIVLIIVLASRSGVSRNVKAAEQAQVVRASRFEVVDQSGKTRAVFGVQGRNETAKLSLNDSEGHQAVFLMVNEQGYATMYFQDPPTEGAVSLGYLWGSDSPAPTDKVDPLASWGMRVRAKNGVQTNFGLFRNGQPIGMSRAVPASQ